jgi:hypothetical protein
MVHADHVCRDNGIISRTSRVCREVLCDRSATGRSACLLPNPGFDCVSCGLPPSPGETGAGSRCRITPGNRAADWSGSSRTRHQLPKAVGVSFGEGNTGGFGGKGPRPRHQGSGISGVGESRRKWGGDTAMRVWIAPRPHPIVSCVNSTSSASWLFALRSIICRTSSSSASAFSIFSVE